MTQKTVTRADLAEAVYGSVGLSRTESAELVERVLELITEALITGDGGCRKRQSARGLGRFYRVADREEHAPSATQ